VTQAEKTKLFKKSLVEEYTSPMGPGKKAANITA